MILFETNVVSVPSTPPIVIEAKGMARKVVLLKFVAPSISNRRIIGYKANIYLDDLDTGVVMWKSEIPDENGNEMYIGELLDQNNLYWFKVTAKAVAGFGTYSRAVRAEILTYDCKLELAVIIINNNNYNDYINDKSSNNSNCYANEVGDLDSLSCNVEDGCYFL